MNGLPFLQHLIIVPVLVFSFAAQGFAPEVLTERQLESWPDPEMSCSAA